MQSSINQRHKSSRSSSRSLFDRAFRIACVAGGVAAAMLAGPASLAAAAAAATAAADSDTEGQPLLQEVVVTGSLIARPLAETAESVQVVSAQDLTTQGVTNVSRRSP